MKNNNQIVRRSIVRATAIQQLTNVSTELLEILPAVIESLERIGLNPLETMQKLIERADKAEVEGKRYERH